MHLNTLSPQKGSKRRPTRLGRGIGSGMGKTCGRGHKGYYARGGSRYKAGFEGGQMPLHRRMPKFGFNSRKALVQTQVTLAELAQVPADKIDLDALKAAGVVNQNIKFVKIFASGEIKQAKTIVGIPVTKGAREAILAAGGKIEE